MDNLRFVLIIVFAMLVYLMMQAWEADYGPKQPVVAEQPVAVEPTREDLPQAANGPEKTAAIGAEPSAPSVMGIQVPASPVITVRTDVIAVEIDAKGGTLRNLDLLNYPVEKENTYVNALRALVGLPDAKINRAPVRLFNADPDKLFLAQSGLIAARGTAAAPNHYTLFNIEQPSYSLKPGQDELAVPLSWTGNDGLKVTKTFIFKRGKYDITVTQEIQNRTGQPWSGHQYSQLLRLPSQEAPGDFLTGGMMAFDGGVVYTEKDKYQKIGFDDMANDDLQVSSPGGWTAMIQHYFASAWIPPVDQENHFYTKALKDGHFVIGSFSPATTVPSNGTATLASRLYAGPKIQPAMEQVAKGLELTVDYSVLTFIGKPIYWLLNQLHSVTGNWGVAIIGVTLCIKLLFFPLSQASFKSMAKMRKIQPRLKELQERFKDDRMRFNNEMMALYKKEQVNPLGGCLPVLVQIPVFMCLYWVLSETVEFRQAPFVLWVQDLSVEDPFYILPLLMGLSMKIQQSLNPAPIDPVQAKVMRMFPIVSTVFFLFFPAGLVLYWVVNNTLSILQQWYITKRIAEA